MSATFGRGICLLVFVSVTSTMACWVERLTADDSDTYSRLLLSLEVKGVVGSDAEGVYVAARQKKSVVGTAIPGVNAGVASEQTDTVKWRIDSKSSKIAQDQWKDLQGKSIVLLGQVELNLADKWGRGKAETTLSVTRIVRHSKLAPDVVRP